MPQDGPPRSISASLTPQQADPAEFAGAVVIVVDALRASATIAAALHSGAKRIIPVLTVHEAQARANSAWPKPILGGERGGILIPGFDLGNSPRDYTPEKIAGRDVVFTTTNGTAALLFANRCGAAEIIVGSFVNLSAMCTHVSRSSGPSTPIHILCAGTGGEVTMDDCLAAGAMVQRLAGAGTGGTISGEAAAMCLKAYRESLSPPSTSPPSPLTAMLNSRGGRNLAAIGLEGDVRDCCTIDAYPVVPRFDPASGDITPA